LKSIALRALATCAFAAPALAAPTYTALGAVQSLEGGWGVDATSVRHSSATLVNPDACTVTNAGYATLNPDPGRSLYLTLLLSAMLNGKQVKLLISGCAFNKPRIISVRIFPGAAIRRRSMSRKRARRSRARRSATRLTAAISCRPPPAGSSARTSRP
jgi:hypothetical protein